MKNTILDMLTGFALGFFLATMIYATFQTYSEEKAKQLQKENNIKIELAYERGYCIRKSEEIEFNRLVEPDEKFCGYEKNFYDNRMFQFTEKDTE